MCCGLYGNYPDDVGYKIAELKPGDQVVILAGEGSPPVSEETIVIVASVKGYSALTADGTALGCHFNTDIRTTGVHFSVYQISPEAQAIIDEMEGISRAQPNSDEEIKFNEID